VFHTILLGTLAGCSELDNCPESESPKLIETGTTDTQTLSYVSAAWDGPLDDFPAKTRLSFVHQLGVTPEIVNSWVSFSGQGTGGSDVTENAGNQGRIECVDSRVIQITNDTCEDRFFIRVVATATGAGSTLESCKD